MNDDHAADDVAPDGHPLVVPPGTGWWWAICGAALFGLLLAAYLSAVSLTIRGVPLGCGEGSGCDEVFRSRWSSVAGLPIGTVAGAAYLGVLICAVLIRYTSGDPRQRVGWFGLTALATAIAAAAVWFVGLQLIVLRAVCPWCMAEHGVGIVLAGLVAVLWRRTRSPSARDIDEIDHPSDAVPVRADWSIGLGIAAAVLFAVVQVMLGGSGSTVARLPGDRNADSGPGPDRQVAVLNGRLVVDVRQAPHIGNPDAPHVLVLLFDYCCPHCRATHGFLAEGLQRYPDQYVIVLLPMPLDTDCNPSVSETEPRFEEACDLARLALAAWSVNPEAFGEFDRWLFEPERPRALTEARQHAESLVDPALLQAALADPAIDARIAADVAAYVQSGAQTIPVLLSPEMDAVVGRTETAEDLFAILEPELGLQPTR
jgi:uncharacterized membrane protein/protein-disulfide isomerase